MFVVHPAGIYHDPDLPTGIDRIRVAHAVKTPGNILQITYPSNIPFRVIPPGARTGG